MKVNDQKGPAYVLRIQDSVMHAAEQLFGGDYLPMRAVFPAVGAGDRDSWQDGDTVMVVLQCHAVLVRGRSG
jgi:hypothetical protein